MKPIFRMFALIIPIILLAFITRDTETNSMYRTPRWAHVITASDQSSDGDTDLIISHGYDTQTQWIGISIMKNINHGGYTLEDSISLFGNSDWIFTARINSDNYPDIIGQFDSNYYTSAAIFLNNNNGSYNEHHVPLGDRITSLFTGDIDGNGSTDFAFASNLNQYWGVSYNNGQGVFSVPIQYNLSFPPTDITTGDLNQDGREDVVIAGVFPKIAFSLSSGFQYQNLPIMFDEVHIAEMDHNGTNDIIGIMNLGVSKIYVFDGSQNFMVYTTTTLSFISDQSIITDLNNDSLPDIVLVPDQLNGLYFLYNLGNNNFSSPHFISVPNEGESWRRICCADLDGNGFNDIAMVRSGGPNNFTFYNLLLFFNDGQGHFVPNPITFIPGSSKGLTPVLKLHPNPFEEKITITINIGTRSLSTLSIYDINGHQIKRLLENNLNPGNYLILWDGKDDWNNDCLPGIYFICLNINGRMGPSQKIIKY
jgi:hypothetical protein